MFLVQARQALTGALKIWWDQSQLHSVNNVPDWQPSLLPAMFVGAKAAAMESNAGPIQVLQIFVAYVAAPDSEPP